MNKEKLTCVKCSKEVEDIFRISPNKLDLCADCFQKEVEPFHFDGWEFPQACIRCGHYDNHDKEFPITGLDVETKLCPDCWSDTNDAD